MHTLIILQVIFKKIIERALLQCTGDREMLNAIARNLNLEVPFVQLSKGIGNKYTFYTCAW